MWIKGIIIYFIGINFIGLVIMAIDKQKAKRHQWRIPEKKLFKVALIGGSIGVLLGMHLFRHKTKHWYFVIGIPVIVLIQILLLLFFIFKFLAL